MKVREEPLSRDAVRAGAALLALILVLLGAMAVKGALLSLPAPPQAPSTNRFDANRAATRLARILGDQRPHPVDSAANDAVRSRLVAELRAIGLQPRITDDFACNGFARAPAVACARVRNVVATLGPQQGRHLLLSAHYDSTFAGPGAGDDGIGVATLLETAALLRARPLRRPVTLLFNEGEEMGLLGARAFLQRDPIAPRVNALLNFEARGVTGPATMFETSRPNGPAVAHFARAAPRPLANSLATDLYRLIPNSTDVSVFEERPWTILNFAIIGNETRYHSAGDDLQALDLRSLQHMGDQAVALALDFAAGEPVEASGERLYADLLGRQLITLPLLFGLVMLGILLVFFFVEAWRRRALWRPLAAAAVGLGGSAGVAALGQLILGLIRSGDYWRGHPSVTSVAVYASAMAACLLALILVGRNVGTARLRVAFWLLFLGVGAAISFVAPGGAIYFLIPPLVAALGIALARRHPAAEGIGAWAAILLLYLTFGPSLALFEELMSSGPHWMF
ncbi:MAG TPA: M28 family peptidase, partial [Allosphingosinicella sp.]|nr:M28 family peptidase [Allosphingosinicella sp.]